MKRIVYRDEDTIQVIRLGQTSNDKIEADKKRKIVQTYTFSRKQYEMVLSGDKTKKMKAFFSVADSNCLDCPYNEYGKCYTHKFNQYVGFKSMLKSIAKEYGLFEELGKFFMASTHTNSEERRARDRGYRSFMAVNDAIEGTINCPASKEGGYKSTCSKCSLCSGTEGKGSKSIYILNH